MEFRVINLRDYTTDRHHVVDDRPFGGGPGMVMKIEPLVAAIRAARQEDPEIKIFLMSPQGPVFSQEKAGELAGLTAPDVNLRSLRRRGRPPQILY